MLLLYLYPYLHLHFKNAIITFMKSFLGFSRPRWTTWPSWKTWFACKPYLFWTYIYMFPYINYILKKKSNLRFINSKAKKGLWIIIDPEKPETLWDGSSNVVYGHSKEYLRKWEDRFWKIVLQRIYVDIRLSI